MASTFIKPEVVAAAALGSLERDVVLPNLIWKDAVTDFRGTKNDTVSIRVPAFMDARTRTMRSNTTITVDDLDETKVDVTLTEQPYKAVGVTDEEMTLDIVDFGTQVLAPVVSSVARQIEDLVVSEMESATYEVELEFDEDDPYGALVDARTALNLHRVPAHKRFLAVGTSVEAAILKSDRLSKFDHSGSDSALRDASIGKIAGFDVVSIPALDPNVAIAGHKTAFVLSTQTPALPDGVVWKSTMMHAGFALRVLKDYVSTTVTNRFLADTFAGTATTKDHGTLDADGRFTPDADEPAILVRAVKLSLPASA